MSYNILEWPNKENWLEIRKKGIGGSEIGAICGYNKYRSPLDVWLDKMGQAPPIEMNQNMEWGLKMEDDIIETFEEKTKLIGSPPSGIFQHKDNLWALANVDALVSQFPDENKKNWYGPCGVLECKYAPSLKITENDLPKHYILQLQWYMYITDLPTGWLAILSVSHGTNFIIREIKRNDKLIEDMLKIGKNFWENHVVPKIPPTPDWCNYSNDALAYFYPEIKNKEVINFDESASLLVEAYQSGNELIKKGEALKEEVGGKLKFLLGENESGLTDNGHYVSYKEVITNRLNTKEIKEKYPAIAEECTTQQKTRRLNISEIKS